MVTIITHGKAKELVRQRKASLKSAKRSCVKMAHQISELTISINQMVTEMPELAKKLEHYSRLLPILQAKLPVLQKSYKGFHKHVASQEVKLDFAQRREALMKKILDAEKELEQG